MAFSRPEFLEGDTVMICEHLYRRACNGHQIAWGLAAWEGRYAPRQEFNREDGTAGACDFVVLCGRCALLPKSDPLLIEEVYLGGQLHVADRMRADRMRAKKAVR